tara:strand:+ start:757 stop:1053 length:297 start_codon:yes stop_codon:yes gene_type:complete
MDLIVENALKNNSNNFNSDNMEIGKANIKVIGVGGAGNNMVNWLYKKGIRGAEIIACNTDKQHLDATEAVNAFVRPRLYKVARYIQGDNEQQEQVMVG